jgi:hypothetical protein
MNNDFKVNLSELWKTVIISFIITIAIFILLIPLFFFNLMEVPLGLLFGGLASTFAFFLFAITEKIKDQKLSLYVTIILIVVMSLIHASALIASGVIYYNAGLHIFNIFATFGGLFIGLIVHVVLVLKSRERNE